MRVWLDRDLRRAALPSPTTDRLDLRSGRVGRRARAILAGRALHWRTTPNPITQEPPADDGRRRTRRTAPAPFSAPAARAGAAADRRPLPYLNRELSWLEFNARVLHEARDDRNPLLERVKFLAIFAGNLDEFFQVRIAGLRQQVEAGERRPLARRPHAGRAARRRARAGPRARRRALEHLPRRPRGAWPPRASSSSTTPRSRSTTTRSASGSSTRSSRS